MSLEIGCLIGHFDIKDYSLIDALQRIGQQQGEILKFAVFEFPNDRSEAQEFVMFVKDKKDKEVPKSITEDTFKWTFNDGNAFRKYALRTASSLDCGITHFSVLVPLNFYDMEQQSVFSIELNTKQVGEKVIVELALKDDQAKAIVGTVVIKGGQVTVEGNEEIANVLDNSELVVNQNGKITIKQQGPSPNLYLGIGFTKYTMDTETDWPPIEQQSPGHLCAANAGVALIEYFERKSQGRHLDASRLFLHQIACSLMNLPATSATTVRSVVRALKLVGVVPEEFYPYDLSKLNEEPSALCYALARNYRASSYLRVDRPNMDKSALIAQICVCRFAYHFWLFSS
jgi:hypothetical protein